RAGTRSNPDRAFLDFQKTGSPQDLGVVFDATAAELLRTARHLVPDQATADDVVQATYLTAIENRQQYKGERPVLSWLFSILTNHARRHHRRRERTWAMERRMGGGMKTDAHAIGNPPPSGVPQPVELLQAEELSQAVKDAIARLPEPYQPVLRFHLNY